MMINALTEKVFERSPRNSRIMKLLIRQKRGRAMRCWFKNCPLCGQGRLFVMRACGTGNLYLHCEQREMAWADPARLGDLTQGELGIDLDGEYASDREIEEEGWRPYAPNVSAG